MKKPRKTTLQRFLEKVDLHSSPDGCWNWRAAGVPAGYGQFWSTPEKIEYAHRYAARVIGGMRIKNKIVRHAVCHNKSCVNPRHLRVGTSADNIADSKAAGHYKVPRPHLTKKEKREVLRAIATGERQQDIAERYSLSTRHVRYLKSKAA